MNRYGFNPFRKVAQFNPKYLVLTDRNHWDYLNRNSQNQRNHLVGFRKKLNK